MKTVYLTFDDGPSDYKEGPEPSHEVTIKILDVLKKYGVKATFFNVGDFTDWMAKGVKNHPQLARRVVEEGHIIGNHTYDHPPNGSRHPGENLDTLSGEEITRELEDASKAIYSAVGYYPIYFRAPGGHHGGEVNNKANKLGMSNHIDWGVKCDGSDRYLGDTRDYDSSTSKDTIVATIRNAPDGAIILCHESFEHTPEALGKVLPELKANPEYCFKTLAEHPNYQAQAAAYRETVYRYRKVDKGLTCFYYSTSSTAEPGWTPDGACFKSAPFVPGAKPVRQYSHGDNSHPLRYSYTIEPYAGNYGPGWTFDNRFAFYACKEERPDTQAVYQHHQILEGGYWNLFYSTNENEPGWTRDGIIFYVYR